MPQADSTLKPAFHPLGDVLHVGRPRVEGSIPADVEEMMREMETIEHHRDPCIRGERQPTREIAGDCEGALRRCLALLSSRIPGALQ